MHAAMLAAVLFALTGVCAAQASWLLGAARANAWRLAIALAVLAAWAHTLGPGLCGGAFGWFLTAGALGFGFGGWCVFQALRRTGSTLTLLIVECAAAVFATLLGWLWLGAALRPGEIAALAMILGGVVLGIRPGPLPDVPARQLALGVAFAVVAAMFQAVSFNLSKHAFNLLATAGESLHPLGAAYHRLLGGCALALLLHAVTHWWRGSRSTGLAARAPFPGTKIPAPAWVAMNALFGPVLGVTCMLWAIRLIDNPGIAQAIAATATLITVPLARKFEGARPNMAWFAGSAIALAGVALLVA